MWLKARLIKFKYAYTDFLTNCWPNLKDKITLTCYIGICREVERRPHFDRIKTSQNKTWIKMDIKIVLDPSNAWIYFLILTDKITYHGAITMSNKNTNKVSYDFDKNYYFISTLDISYFILRNVTLSKINGKFLDFNVKDNI